MTTCIELTEGQAFPIKVEQHEDRTKLFRVTYGKEVTDDLDYQQAANEFGLCVFHSLACEGKLDNAVDL